MIEKHELACLDFDVVIRKNPTNANAHFRRAFSLKAQGAGMSKDKRAEMYQLAVEDFEKAKNLDPMNEKLLVNYKMLKNIQCIVLCEPGNEIVFS